MATLYEVTLQGTYQNQSVVNRLNFASDIDGDPVVSAFNLAQALGYDVGDPSTPITDTSFLYHWLGAQSNAYQLQQLTFRALYSVTDFFTLPVSGAGWAGFQLWSGDELMSFVAVKFRTNRTRTDVRPGTFALTPPNEESTDDEGIISGTVLGLYDEVIDALNAPPSWTAGMTTVQFRPAVCGKEKYAVPDTDPVRYAYRYWPTEAAQLLKTAIGVTWSYNVQATTQTSRRRGKGN